MTVAAGNYFSDEAGTKRWAVSLLLVLALHAGLLLIIALRRMPAEPIGMPPAAVMIDLAPAPAATPAGPPPPPPADPEAHNPPPEPPKLAPSPAPHPELALPEPPPKPKPKAKRIEHPAPPRRQVEPAVPHREPAPATAPAAPSQPLAARSMPSTSASTSASWQAQLVAWLEKYKHYPRVAQEQHQQGVAHLRFAIDRQGRVLSSQISKSSGFALLDEEVLALIQRAQPLPSPPPEIGGNRIELQVPVAFSLRR